jgi:small subunit ribosomal protein S18
MRRQKKTDPFAEARIRFVDYKDDRLLSRFISETGKVLPGRLTGATARHQRQVALAIKKARFLALLPYTKGSQS